MLEDSYQDVIGKALVGAGLTEQKLVRELEISDKAWRAFMKGDFDTAIARSCAATLGLNGAALANHPTYAPEPVEIAGVHRLDLPFGNWTVNAWWVALGDACLVFDAGMGPRDVVDAAPMLPQHAFMTHGHHDHVGGVEALIEKGVCLHGAEFSGNRRAHVGDAFDCGDLHIVACDLSGHYVPALGYHVAGLELPVLVVGDALFAGSMGKTPGPERYQLALHTLREALDGLPDETVLLPGHGPATTVGEERRANPFLGG